MNRIEISRVYTKRETEKSNWSGRIGAVTLAIDPAIVEDDNGQATGIDLVFTLDGKELPLNSVEHLLTFALQSLQDAYAGAESLDEAIGAWEKKRNRLYEGTLGTRDGSGGEEPYMRLVRDIIRTKMSDEKKAEYKAMKGDGDARKDFLDAIFDAMPEEKQTVVVDAAKRMLAAELAAKAATRALSADIDI